MLYVEIEQHINDDGTEIDMSEDKMSLLLPGHLQNREAEFKEDAPEAMVLDAHACQRISRADNATGRANIISLPAASPATRKAAACVGRGRDGREAEAEAERPMPQMVSV